MTRSQALTIGVLAGFVILVFAGMIVLIVFPYERIFPPAPTATLPPPTSTPTPTFPSFLPTGSLITPTPAEPTSTNTRLPTATPRPPKAPAPTVIFKLPSPILEPTPTVEATTAVPIPTATSSPTIVPAPRPRGYSISFDAKKSTITEGKCTELKWHVEGATTVMLDGQSVASSDKKKVCPKKDTSYQLTIQLPDNTPSVHKTVKISVEEEQDD